jgi:tRNA uridine 5-carboxymethylaminomethyl modification enzyme
MFTSRAEYRLLLRHDNADRRLTPLGHRIGLVEPERWRRLESKEAQIAAAREILETSHAGGVSLARLLRRPEITWTDVIRSQPKLAAVSQAAAEQVTWDVKYAGYIARDQIEVARQSRLAARCIPEAFDFASVRHLRAEAREKLSKVRPLTLAQASRISGITPADVALLSLYLGEGRASHDDHRGTEKRDETPASSGTGAGGVLA